MNTFHIIDLLIKEKRLKQIDLTNYLGISKSHYSDWKTGRTSSYTKYLPQIAEFFGVSVDYLVGKTDKKEKPADEGELTENVVIFHRDGKTVTKKIAKRHMEMFVKMLEAFPEEDDG